MTAVKYLYPSPIIASSGSTDEMADGVGDGDLTGVVLEVVAFIDGLFNVIASVPTLTDPLLLVLPRLEFDADDTLDEGVEDW